MDAAQYKEKVFCWKDLLFRLALRLLDDTAEAQDAVQQTLMKMWQNKDRLNEIDNLKSFVVKAVQNDCLNRLKKAKTVTQHHGNLVKMQSQVTEITESNMLEIIKREINKLPEKQKIIIQLFDVEGFDIKEIAAIIDIEEGSVRTNLSRARQKIKCQIKKMQEYEARQL